MQAPIIIIDCVLEAEFDPNLAARCGSLLKIQHVDGFGLPVDPQSTVNFSPNLEHNGFPRYWGC